MHFILDYDIGGRLDRGCRFRVTPCKPARGTAVLSRPATSAVRPSRLVFLIPPILALCTPWASRDQTAGVTWNSLSREGFTVCRLPLPRQQRSRSLCKHRLTWESPPARFFSFVQRPSQRLAATTFRHSWNVATTRFKERSRRDVPQSGRSLTRNVKYWSKAPAKARDFLEKNSYFWSPAESWSFLQFNFPILRLAVCDVGDERLIGTLAASHGIPWQVRWRAVGNPTGANGTCCGASKDTIQVERPKASRRIPKHIL